jgi:hypothetical protein
MVDADIERQQLTRKTNGSFDISWLARDMPQITVKSAPHRQRLDNLSALDGGTVVHPEL